MIQTDEGAAQITDFDPAEDSVTISVDGLDSGTPTPVLSYDADPDTGTTTVSLDGTATLVLDGIFTPEDLDVSLADPQTIDFIAPTD